jgi:hypothetical protein
MPEGLQQAIAHIKAGDKQQGKRLLAEALIQDPGQEVAWLLMAGIVDYDEHRRYCLEQVLRLNPSNQYALNGLATLQPGDMSQEATQQPSMASAASHESTVDADKSDIPLTPSADVENEAFVQKVESSRGRESARRKSPIVFVIAIIVIVGGLTLFFLNAPVVVDFALDPQARPLDAPAILQNLLLMTLGGALTVAGLVGIWWALGSSNGRPATSQQQPGVGHHQQQSMVDLLDDGIWLDTSHSDGHASGIRLL